MNLIKHLCLTLKHKYYVLIYACILKIGYLGIIHDFSKFSLSEFLPSAKYYLGNMSPQFKERENNDGYSFVCVRHVGRNKHHWQYWIDYVNDGALIYRIPFKYALEFICDSLAATKIYCGKDYDNAKPFTYFSDHQHTYLMHPATKFFIYDCLNDYRLRGKKALSNKDLKIKYDLLAQDYPKVMHLKISATDIE